MSSSLNLSSLQDLKDGGGISLDTKSFSWGKCFNVTEVSDQELKQMESLNNSVSYVQLKEDLNIDTSDQIGAGRFSFEPVSPYIRFIED